MQFLVNTCTRMRGVRASRYINLNTNSSCAFLNMAVLCKVFLLVAFASLVLAVDRTVEEGAVGTDVVVATISKIESASIFPSDKRLLRRIAYVETADGEDPPSTGRYGGIWNVRREKFQRTKGDQSLIVEVNAAFEVEFSKLSLRGRDWNSVEWEDLNVPLLSALAARLLIHRYSNIPTSSNIEGQASFWRRHYNTAGNENKFIQDVKDLDQDEGKQD